MARKKKNIVVSLSLKKKLLLALPDESDSFCGYARKCLRDSLQTADVRDECVLRREVCELIQMVRQQYFHRPGIRSEAESALARLLLFALSKSLGLMHRTGSSIPGHSTKAQRTVFCLEVLLNELELSVLMESLKRLPRCFQETLIVSVIRRIENYSAAFLDETLTHKTMEFLETFYKEGFNGDAENGDAGDAGRFRKKLEEFLLKHGKRVDLLDRNPVETQNYSRSRNFRDGQEGSSPLQIELLGEYGTIKSRPPTVKIRPIDFNNGRSILTPNAAFKGLFVIQEEFSNPNSSSGKQNLGEAMAGLLEQSPLSRSFLRHYFSEDKLSRLKKLLKTSSTVELEARRRLIQACNRLSSHDISAVYARELMIISIIAPSIVVESLLDRGIHGGQRELVAQVFSVLRPLAETFEFYSSLIAVIRRSSNSKDSQPGSLTYCSLVSKLLTSLLEKKIISTKILENLVRGSDLSGHSKIL